MKIQIEFPDEYNKILKLYQVNNELKTKAEAVVKLAIEKLEPEKEILLSRNKVLEGKL